jgi:hypothetical protein
LLNEDVLGVLFGVIIVAIVTCEFENWKK